MSMQTLRISPFCFIPLLGLVTVAVRAAVPPNVPRCRFSPLYSQHDILANPGAFVWDLLYWEGQFHQDSVGYNEANGMTYDGTLLDPTTGLARSSGLHPFSAASKESLHVMVLTHAIAGNPLAARFLSPRKPQDAPGIARRIMEAKLRSYLQFNETYPGFGGFLPWFLSNDTTLRPTADWENRVPALDNGELLWAVYGAIEALENSWSKQAQSLAKKWQVWLDYTKNTAAEVSSSSDSWQIRPSQEAVQVFYNGTGHVCAVTAIGNQSAPMGAPNQSYGCEGSQTLNDPYEGELFTWWLYFFSPQLTISEKEELWVSKRQQLVAAEWRSNMSWGDVTVQKGYWFSSHEQWKLLEMPYTDVDLVKRIFHNAERARTCDSFLKRTPGMYASVNNVTGADGEILGYISNAGIPAVSFLSVQELDVITPYSVFPTILFNQSVGLAWWKNMIDGKGMQNPYGSTESERVDGSGISSFVSWDSKITTVTAILGGVINFVRDKLRREGFYDEFLRVTQREHELVFKAALDGEDLDLCLPNAGVPTTHLEDYESCRSR